MFWNDPNLYTASLPYREFGFTPNIPFAGQTFTPWQHVPRFMPPTFGVIPPVDPRMFMPNPFMAQTINPLVGQQINPFLGQQFNPFLGQQFNPMVGQTPNPFLSPFNVNVPFGMHRPFGC